MSTKHSNIPASYLFLEKENKILLLRRYNTKYEDGKYSMIAGHVDPGETFSQCIVREAKEEAGIFIAPEDITVAHIMQRNSQKPINNERIDVFFTVKKWTGEIQNKEPQKCDDLSWFDINNLPENTIPYIKHVITCISNNVFYSEYGWE
jgi:mutator protein MutT